MVVNGRKLGDILLDANVLTKRQLSRALAMQETGDKRKIGEILVDLNYITLDDLTDIMLSNGSPHEERVPVEKEIQRTVVKQEPVIKKQPIDITPVVYIAMMVIVFLAALL